MADILPTSAPLLKTMPTNAEVSAAIRISEIDVARYRRESSRLADGSWLINFRYDMPAELRKHLTGSFTIVMDAVKRD